MADKDDTDTGEDAGEGNKETPKQLRTKLETTLSENADLRGKLLIHEAGLGHLTQKQRNAVVNDAKEGGKELTPDLLKASAKELGFPETLGNEGDKPNPNDANNGDQAGNENGDEGDPTTNALTGMEAIEAAQRRTTTVAADGSFEQKLNNAKTQAEVEALIRTEGSKVGLVHEWDVD